MIGSWRAAAPPPGTIRDRADEILNRPEFEQHKSVLQRVVEWIGDQLNRFSFGIGGGPGFLGNLIGLLFVVGAVVLLVVLIRSFRRAPRAPVEDELSVEEEARRSAKQWRTDAERFEAEQRWREAMRARYRELIRELVDDRVLVDVPGRTTGEYRAELAAARPPAAPAFDALTELFEIAWYGGRPTGATQHQQFRQLAAAVREQVLRSIEPEREPEPARAR